MGRQEGCTYSVGGLPDQDARAPCPWRSDLYHRGREAVQGCTTATTTALPISSTTTPRRICLLAPRSTGVPPVHFHGIPLLASRLSLSLVCHFHRTICSPWMDCLGPDSATKQIADPTMHVAFMRCTPPPSLSSLSPALSPSPLFPPPLSRVRARVRVRAIELVTLSARARLCMLYVVSRSCACAFTAANHYISAWVCGCVRAYMQARACKHVPASGWVG